MRALQGWSSRCSAVSSSVVTFLLLTNRRARERSEDTWRDEEKGERVLGPYREGRKWRIVLAEEPDAQKRRLYFETEREAIKAKRIAEQEFEETAGVTIKEAIEGYEMLQRTEKKDKPRSVADTVYRLGLAVPRRERIAVVGSDLEAVSEAFSIT